LCLTRLGWMTMTNIRRNLDFLRKGYGTDGMDVLSPCFFPPWRETPSTILHTTHPLPTRPVDAIHICQDGEGYNLPQRSDDSTYLIMTCSLGS
jgi:hypothetical protein